EVIDLTYQSSSITIQEEGNMKAGSVWVQGTKLYFISEGSASWYYEGSVVTLSNPQAIPGSLWQENNTLRYVDATNTVRAIPHKVLAGAPGIIGSLWVEGALMAWINSSGAKTV